MKNKVTDAIKKFLAGLKNIDELPDEVVDAACEMAEEVKDGLEEQEMEDEENPDITTEDEEDPNVNDEDLDTKIADAVSKALKDAGIKVDKSMDALENIETEDEEEGEESVTVSAEKSNDAATILKKIKPVIASIKDAKTRKILSDSFAKLIKGNTATNDDAYVNILGIVSKNKSAQDSKAADDSNVGIDIAKKYNPHYMNK